MTRIPALDGLRGWAAFVVFLYHALDIFYPHVIGSQIANAQPSYSDSLSPALRVLPLAWIINANFSVCLFFALSGFVLTLLALSKERNAQIATLIAQRWFRLFPVVLIGSILGFITLKSCGHLLGKLSAVNGSTNANIFSAYMLEHVSYLELAKQVFWKAWGNATPDDLFGRVLWTIGLEFKGSIVIFMLIPVFRKVKDRCFVYLAILLIGTLFLGAIFMLFAAGSFLADLYFRDRIPARFKSQPLCLALLVAALLVASVHATFDGAVWLSIGDLQLGSYARLVRLICYTFACCALILAALFLQPMTRFLGGAFGRWLGHISYSLYATHQPLLYSVGMSSFFMFFPGWSYFQSTVVAASVALGVCLILSYCIASFIDLPANRITKKWVERVISNEAS